MDTTLDVWQVRRYAKCANVYAKYARFLELYQRLRGPNLLGKPTTHKSPGLLGVDVITLWDDASVMTMCSLRNISYFFFEAAF
jgi:hypothetical protein